MLSSPLQSPVSALQDKLSCLGGHLWLHSIIAALADGEGTSFKKLSGGLPPAVPLWSLKLASAIHESCLGQACLHLAALQASSGAGHRICVYLYWKSFKCASRRAGVGSMTLK